LANYRSQNQPTDSAEEAYFKSETDTRSCLQNSATVSLVRSYLASRRCHSASFFRSTPRPMSCLRYRWKRSTDRGYQGLQGWLWCAHTHVHHRGGRLQRGQRAAPARTTLRPMRDPEGGLYDRTTRETPPGRMNSAHHPIRFARPQRCRRPQRHRSPCRRASRGRPLRGDDPAQSCPERSRHAGGAAGVQRTGV